MRSLQVNVTCHNNGLGRNDGAVKKSARPRTFLVMAVVLALIRPVEGAPPPQLSKPQIEAAYLYNFTRFVEWPATVFANDRSPLVLGVLGQDPFGSLLDDLVSGERINGRPIIVRRFARVADVDDCHVLFI